jgi:hypothetical protein
MFLLKKRLLGLVLLGASLAVTSQAAPVRYRVGVGFGRGYWGPGWGYGYGPYGYYGFGGGPVFYNSHPNAGQLKFDTKQKEARVYIDGGFAGEVRDAKGLWLRAGTHDVEVRGAVNGEDYSEQIYVAPGKTLHVRPGF